jgi:hypothetical protein
MTATIMKNMKRAVAGEYRFYVSSQHVEVDDDVAAEYWTKIRGMAAPPARTKAK